MRFIMAVVLIDMLAVGLIVPVLPLLVGKFASNPNEQTWWFGAVTLTFAVSSFFGAPLLGALSDRYGRRPILLIGFCGLSLNFFATALATSMAMLLVSRILGGAMQANAAVANAYVADISAPEERSRRFGLLGAMFGIGFILGPVLGGILGDIDLRLPFVVAGSLGLVNLLNGVFVLPESLPAEGRRKLTVSSLNPFAALRDLANLKGVGLLVGTIACASIAQFVLYTSWVLYCTFKFHWGPREIGWSLFAVGVVAALTQGVLLARLLKRWSPQRLTVLGLASSTLAYLLWGLATEGWMMYAVIAVNILGSAVTASIQGLISSASDARQQGRTMGSVSALGNLAAVAGPVLATPLLAAVAHLPAGDWRIGTPMFFCAALTALALALAQIHFRRDALRGLPAGSTT
jgi:DHA1 family tetracycline resistance protein-like MFS transporter